jgi:hypothetical protein
MQKILNLSFLLFTLFGLSQGTIAQNLLSTTGNVGIGTTSPQAPLDVRFTGASTSSNALGIQSVVLNSNSTSFWGANAFSAEQPVGKVGNFVCLGLTSTTSNPSGNVQNATTLSLIHNHTGAGTLGEAHVVDGRFIVNAGDGNVTSAMMYWGSMFVPNGGAQTNTITNAYGLYITNFPTNVTNRYGVYIQDVAASNYFGGTLTVGTTTVPAGYNLAVNGAAICTRMVVKTFPWSDYVFQKDYRLPSLDSVALYVKEHRHLSGIPSADDVEKSGVDVGANQALLLKKVEELTLYLIEQNKELAAQKKEIKSMKKKIRELSSHQ